MRRFFDRLLIRLRIKKPKPKRSGLSRYQDLIGGRNPRRGKPMGK
jgi:hypothetical protein